MFIDMGNIRGGSVKMTELIDTKELVESLKGFFDCFEYHTKRINTLIKKWREEDD